MAVNRKAFQLAKETYPDLRDELEQRARVLLQLPNATDDKVMQMIESETDLCRRLHMFATTPASAD